MIQYIWFLKWQNYIQYIWSYYTKWTIYTWCKAFDLYITMWQIYAWYILYLLYNVTTLYLIHFVLIVCDKFIGLYSFTMFCSRYHQLIAILVIILVIVYQYGWNIDAVMTWSISNTKERVRGLALFCVGD